MAAGPLLVRSSHCEVLELSDSVIACGHSFLGKVIPLDRDYLKILESFATPKTVDRVVDEHAESDPVTVREAARFLLESGFLVDLSLGTEHSQVITALRRRILVPERDAEAPPRIAWYEVAATRRPRPPLGIKVKVLFYGLCNVQVGMDLLRQMAEDAGIDVEGRVTVFNDISFVPEWQPDFIVIGFLPERHGVLAYPVPEHSKDDHPPERYEQRLRDLVGAIRVHSQAPLLILNFPTPTCSPFGVADQGRNSHVNKARRINIGIASIVDENANAFVVDLDTAWSLWGKRHLVDDTFETFSHLGSLSYVRFLGEQPPSSLKDALPPLDLMPGKDLGPLRADRITAECILLIIRTVLGHQRKKCVIVDLDNTLWPGVLADTGAPFPADTPYDTFAHGLYVGVHNALRALRDRGLLLAVCSKNDEELVRRLWVIPDVLRGYGLLTFDDFVIHRINWRDKVDNIADIARTLNIGLDTVVFVDDNPIEREHVRMQLPDVMLMGDNPFTLRWELLTRPELQIAVATSEAQGRQKAVGGQLQRERELAAAVDRTAFLQSLGLTCEVERITASDSLDRIHELVVRTNQFNTTGRRYSREQIEGLMRSDDGSVFAMRARDRLADYGLVAASLAKGGLIESFVMSCRVIGLGLEYAFLDAIVSYLKTIGPEVEALYTSTERNTPSRRLLPLAGFSETAPGRWILVREREPSAAHDHVTVTLRGFGAV